MSENPTPVMFRKWPDGDIIALFPTQVKGPRGKFCSSYASIGGHAVADYSSVIRRTRPATKAEYARVFDELWRCYGYDLKVCKKKPRG